nr:putative transposase (putative), gypsy type [Tanacetum cinerariifolium]
MLRPEFPGPGDRIVDFPEGKVDKCVFPPAVEWRTNASKDAMPASGTYSVEAVRVLDTHRTPIQKQPEALLMPASGTYSVEAVRVLDTHRTPIQKQSKALLCLVGISRRYYLGDDVYSTFHYDDDREMDLFSLIRAPNPTKVKTGSRPRAPHELPLLTLTASRVIEIDEPAAATDSSGVPSAIEKSLLDFSDEAEAFGQETAAPEVPSSQGVAVARNPGYENVSSSTVVGSSGSVYRPEWGVTNGSLLDTPEACQDLVDHAAPSSYFSELRHMHNDDFLGQYNINLARQVAMGSQLRMRFEQEAKLLRKSVAQVARREQRIQARESEIKSLEALLETEADMKRAAKEKSAGLSQELERMRAQFSKLQVSNERLSQQVDALQQQVFREETLKAAFEDYKRQQDQMVEQRCAEMDARLDSMSIDFDEELYPHMLTAIAGRRWVIGHGLRLATMKCDESLEMRQAFTDVVSAGIAKGMNEGLKHRVEHGHAQRTIESLEAYDPEAEAKFTAALQSLKDLKLPLLDQLKGLKDALMDVIMASLYLEDDTRDDAPQFIRDLHPSSSQLAIPVYPEVRDPQNPWACTEEIKLVDAIAANISRVEQKKRSRIVCRTHGVGSAHHARSDRVPVSAPIVVPQGLALILVDAATQTDPDA